MVSCDECKYFEDIDGNKYSCRFLRERKVEFVSDGCDTAEGCNHFVKL